MFCWCVCNRKSMYKPACYLTTQWTPYHHHPHQTMSHSKYNRRNQKLLIETICLCLFLFYCSIWEGRDSTDIVPVRIR